MRDKKLIEEMTNFCRKFNFNSIEDCSGMITLEEVVQFQNDGLRGKTTEEIESFIFKIHSYNAVLKNKRSSLKAFTRGLTALLDRHVSDNIDNVDKYLPYQSKREIICSKDAEFSAILNRLIQGEMHLDKIGDLPEAIDSTLRSIEAYMRRRYSI